MASGRRPLDYLRRRVTPVHVWAVEDTTAQVMWGHLPQGRVVLEAEHAGAVLDHPGGAGGLTITGLEPDSAVMIRVMADGVDKILSTRTLPTPPGELCAVVATVSDLHLVEHSWGFLKTMTEIEPDLEPYATRCAKAAIHEAQQWGAEHLVIKGDAAHHRNPHSYEQLGLLVDSFPDFPMSLIPGNHDVDRHGDIELPDGVGSRKLQYERGVGSLDLGGARIVTIDTTIERQNHGAIAHQTERVVAALASDRPTIALLHHQLQKGKYPRYWPPGIPGPEALPFLDAISATNQRLLLSSGHTHRNRRRDYKSTIITEVASTKDWPGVWAGYAIHEGGVRQVVRRIEHHQAAAWHEYSQHAVLGVWSKWSPGRMSQRCFTQEWDRMRP